MKKSCLIALLLLTAGISTPAIAEDSDAVVVASTDQNKAEAEPKEKKICRSEKITGTRSKVNRSCKTRAQWDAIAEATRRSMNEFDRKTNSGAPALSDRTNAGGPAGPS